MRCIPNRTPRVPGPAPGRTGRGVISFGANVGSLRRRLPAPKGTHTDWIAIDLKQHNSAVGKRRVPPTTMYRHGKLLWNSCVT